MTERSIIVTIEEWRDAVDAGKQTQNELYRQFQEEDVDEFEVTIIPVEDDDGA